MTCSTFVLKIYTVENQNKKRTFIQPKVVINVSRETIKKIKLFLFYGLTVNKGCYKVFFNDLFKNINN